MVKDSLGRPRLEQVSGRYSFGQRCAECRRGRRLNQKSQRQFLDGRSAEFRQGRRTKISHRDWGLFQRPVCFCRFEANRAGNVRHFAESFRFSAPNPADRDQGEIDRARDLRSL